jgi:hypothetical protein
MLHFAANITMFIRQLYLLHLVGQKKKVSYILALLATCQLETGCSGQEDVITLINYAFHPELKAMASNSRTMLFGMLFES